MIELFALPYMSSWAAPTQKMPEVLPVLRVVPEVAVLLEVHDRVAPERRLERRGRHPVGPRVDPGRPGQPDEPGGVRPLREHDRRDRDEGRHAVADLVAVVELRRERRAHDLVDRVVRHIRDTSISRAEPPTASR